jgi:uncharacterized protein
MPQGLRRRPIVEEGKKRSELQARTRAVVIPQISWRKPSKGLSSLLPRVVTSKLSQLFCAEFPVRRSATAHNPNDEMVKSNRVKISLRELTDYVMGFQQYHEPANELSQETRTFARMIASLIEEAEAINWYEQRLSVEKDPDAKAIMADAQGEEFKHFGMDLEFLLRRKPKWKGILQEILFQEGDIVKHGEQAEKDNE